LWFRDYLITQIKKQGVEIKLSKEVRSEDIVREKPEVIIAATGAVQWVPNIPGIHGPNVSPALDILAEKAQFKGKQIGILEGEPSVVRRQSIWPSRETR